MLGFDVSIFMFVLGAVCFCASIVFAVVAFYAMNDDRKLYVDDCFVMDRLKRFMNLSESNQVKLEKIMDSFDDH